MEPKRVILMACGSFNPPTNMHLRMFEIARDHLHRMGSYIVMGGVISPTHDNYGKNELASSEHRCAMLKLALKNSDWIRVSTWESRQNNWTPTRICLQNHQNLVNTVLFETTETKNYIDPQDLEWIPENVRNCQNKSPIQIKLLCGADLLETFGIPGLWADEDIDTIVGQHGLVVITREGSNPNKFIYDSDLLFKHMHNICIVTEWICNEVSSTKIRRALKRGESVRYLIPDSVISYIHDQGLYDAKTSLTTKLTWSNNSNDYLHINPKYASAFLTPSPSDIIMDSPSPVEIISIDINEAVIKKNILNSPNSRSLIDSNDTERVREKFLNVISENGNKITSILPKSSYPGQAKQIIATETGESQIFREVGSRSKDTNGESLNIIEEDIILKGSNSNVNDEKMTVITDDIESRVCCTAWPSNVDGEPFERRSSIQVTREYSNDILNEKPLEVIANEKGNECNISVVEESVGDVSDQNISPPVSIFEEREERKPSITECQEPYEKVLQVRKSRIDSSPRRDDIDGKYLKSIVNSRKSPKRVINLAEQVVPMMEEATSTATLKKTNEHRVSKPESSRKVYQGSLDSINSSKLMAVSKKSKSLEFIKCDLSLKEFKQPKEEVAVNLLAKTSSSTFVGASDISTSEHIYENQPIDEYCAVCCYDKDQPANKNPETVRSTNSSPVDADSGDCEFCRSCNLQENEAISAEPQCELCEICGDMAMEMDVVASSKPESDQVVEARLHGNSKHLPFNLSKRKLNSGRVKLDGRIFDITDEGADFEEDAEDDEKVERPPSTSVEEYSADDSTLNDVEFEIDNCGSENDTIQLTEATPVSTADDVSKKQKIDLLENVREDSKKMTRGSSMITRPTSKPESRRRYSSVDNLPKQTYKTALNVSSKLVTNQKKVTGSVDNIRVSRITKSSKKLGKSADDVVKQCQEAVEPQGNAKQSVLNEQSEKRVESDIIKFVISKDGLKIISDRETAL